MKPWSQSTNKATAPKSFLLPLVTFAFLSLVPRKDKLTFCHNRISVCLLECSIHGITCYKPSRGLTSFAQHRFSEIGPHCSVCATAFVSRLMLSVKNRNCLCFWCSSIALHFSLGSFCWHVLKLTNYDFFLGCIKSADEPTKGILPAFCFLASPFVSFLTFPSISLSLSFMLSIFSLTS